jgi:general L-amino acid transport system permease protein
MTAAVDTIEPPSTSVGVLGWLKKNLFSTWYNALLTIVMLWLIYVVGTGLLNWAFTGARWNVIGANLRLFMVGPYPPDQVWRVWLVVALVSVLFGLSAGVFGGTIRTFANSLAAALAALAVLQFATGGVRELTTYVSSLPGQSPVQWLMTMPPGPWLVAGLVLVIGAYLLGHQRKTWRRWLIPLWLLAFALTIVLLQGFAKNNWLPTVSTTRWGGLLLTFMLSVVAIVISFPLGVLLALGRRSQLPAVKVFSVLYIELVRGVPLVTILYMTQIMLPLFLPGEVRVDNVLRAIAGMTLFTAAYMAENVRGGLQAIPTGQIEAAQAVGLNNALVTLFIVLPQALRMVIPSIVGLFIALFKDTTLVMIVGQLDLLGVGRSVLAQPEYLGLQMEVYVFVAALFFIFSYAMSFASYRLEAALGVGKR